VPFKKSFCKQSFIIDSQVAKVPLSSGIPLSLLKKFFKKGIHCPSQAVKTPAKVIDFKTKNCLISKK